MSKAMNKEFSYKDYKFNIKVELNSHFQEKKGNKGQNPVHRVQINDMGAANWCMSKDASTDTLEKVIKELEGEAIKYAENRIYYGKSYEERILMDLGFK